MKVCFSHIEGWSGGEWRADGMSLRKFQDLHGFDPFPRPGTTGDVIGPTGSHPIVCSERTRTIRGVDHDHGHEYPWQYEEPMFHVGPLPFPISASDFWREGYTIMLEVP